jgi:O-antigen/teichoic acid export membrane protein
MIALPFILNCLFNFATGLMVAKLLGPAEYGRYALVMSTALVLQCLGLEWLRLSTIRFYSDQERLNHPEIRATLDMTFVVIAGVATVVALLTAYSGLRSPISGVLVALSIVTACALALFEISAASLRARFNHRAYGLFVVGKNVLSILLTVGGAWTTGSARMALIGMIVSIVGSVVLSYRLLRDTNARLSQASWSLVRRFAAYGFPVVVANVFYQAVPMANRAWVSQIHGFAEAGQLALASDIGIRIVGSIGSALDVLLFQVAVATERTSGLAAARQEVSRNMGLIIAVLAPTTVGFWLVLPSFEHLLVPASYQGQFAHYMTILMPGIACYVLAMFCIAPAFQIMHRTGPLIAGGVLALVAYGAAIKLLPISVDASSPALAQSISSIVGLATILVLLSLRDPLWPPLKDVVGTTFATLLMLIVLVPLRAMPAGVVSLALQICLGGFVYGAAALACNLCGLQTIVRPRLGWALAWGRPSERPSATISETTTS